MVFVRSLLFVVPFLGLLGNAAGQVEFQINQPTASMATDGVQGSATAKATLSSCIGTVVNLSFASPLQGQIFDVALSSRALRSVTGGAFVSGGNQIVNVDFTDPSFQWMFGGATVGSMTFPGNFTCPCPTLPYAVSSALTNSGQMLIIDPTAADGSSLSQGCEVVYGTIVNGPTTDDSGVTVALSSLGGCAPSSLSFYGVAHSSFSVISNGRLVFGAVDIDFSPTVAEAITDSPFFGAWADMNPATAGTIRIISDNPGSVRVEYRGVPYFANATAINNFDFIIETSGIITINGVNGIVTGTGQQFLGLSAGTSGPATDPGATTFSVSGPNLGPAGFGMIYSFGTQGSRAPGVAVLTFIPNALGNYDWIGS